MSHGVWSHPLSLPRICFAVSGADTRSCCVQIAGGADVDKGLQVCVSGLTARHTSLIAHHTSRSHSFQRASPHTASAQTGHHPRTLHGVFLPLVLQLTPVLQLVLQLTPAWPRTAFALHLPSQHAGVALFSSIDAGTTALHLAVKWDQDSIVDILIEAGASLSSSAVPACVSQCLCCLLNMDWNADADANMLTWVMFAMPQELMSTSNRK